MLLNATEGANHWITLKLEGAKSNRDGIGALVKISTSAGDQYAAVTTVGSYQSSSDPRVHFGLGSDSVIKVVEIHWPSGIMQTLKAVRADQILIG